MDGLIQNNEPTFVAVWVGSIVAVVTTLVSGCFELTGAKLAALVLGSAAYVLGQITTFTINVPRNNRVKTLDIPSLSDFEKKRERDFFEPTWNKWNLFRVALFGLASIDFLWLLLLARPEI